MIGTFSICLDAVRRCNTPAGDANLYRYVGNRPTNAVDPSGLATRERVEEESLVYTCNCGWVDTGHLTEFGIVNKVRGRKTGLKSISRNGYKISGTGSSDAPFYLPYFVGYYARDYFVATTLGDKENSVALAIMHDLAFGHETSQNESVTNAVGILLGIGGTGFSEEDLPSHELGFYMKLLNLTKEQVLEKELCHKLTKAQSLRVWDEGGDAALGHPFFRPAYKNTKTVRQCCGTSPPKWPDKFDSVTPSRSDDSTWAYWRTRVMTTHVTVLGFYTGSSITGGLGVVDEVIRNRVIDWGPTTHESP